MLEVQLPAPQIFTAAVTLPNLSGAPHRGLHHTLKTADLVFVV